MNMFPVREEENKDQSTTSGQMEINHFVKPEDTEWWCSGSSYCGSSDGKGQRILGELDEKNGWLFSGVPFNGMRKVCLGKG